MSVMHTNMIYISYLKSVVVRTTAKTASLAQLSEKDNKYAQLNKGFATSIRVKWYVGTMRVRFPDLACRAGS